MLNDRFEPFWSKKPVRDDTEPLRNPQRPAVSQPYLLLRHSRT
jgi:hypothetical protein